MAIQVKSVDESIGSVASEKSGAIATEKVNQTKAKETVEVSEASVKAHKFIKNINPIEKIVLSNGETVQFPNGKTVWFVHDEKLAKSLKEVSKKYNIIVE